MGLVAAFTVAPRHSCTLQPTQPAATNTPSYPRNHRSMAAADTFYTALSSHAFREPAPAAPLRAAWAPQPEPEPQPAAHDNDMALDWEMDGIGGLDCLPDLLWDEDDATAVFQPWVSPCSSGIEQKPTTAPKETAASDGPDESGSDGDSPSVFRCDEPASRKRDSDAMQGVAVGIKRQNSGARKKRVTFGAVNRVRTIPAVVCGVPQSGVLRADCEEQLKTTDGPSRASALVDLLVRCFYSEEGGVTNVQYLQHLLSSVDASARADVAAAAPQISGLCWQLAEKLSAIPDGGHSGMLPSNTRLCAAHAEGCKTIAEWLWSCPVPQLE